eukprot:CAMPEP_0172667074 /NCGR_PEP_ID=MMETSP1074-20121228/8200_1 /TAXON_ID=2916 /ORGANISM="Ceratium fusus, Strain PA161109" /LENGTH=51 /DNA_ID=CAMNT_0013483537 /DNA_START=10 /DNA_END=163 /DNA_ORIENTATION=-
MGAALERPATQHPADIPNKVTRVVVRNTGAPADANTVSTVDKDRGDHWAVP